LKLVVVDGDELDGCCGGKVDGVDEVGSACGSFDIATTAGRKIT